MSAFPLVENRLIDAYANMQIYKKYLSSNAMSVTGMIKIPSQTTVVISTFLGVV